MLHERHEMMEIMKVRFRRQPLLFCFAILTDTLLFYALILFGVTGKFSYSFIPTC